MKKVRARICVNGIVQGVGFRPFIHKLAGELELAGWIRNSKKGVEIVIEGYEGKVDEFISKILTEKPDPALIESLDTEKTHKLQDLKDFVIIESESEGDVKTLISPDLATCGDCLKELFDPKDRRYRYPFINCTNCGPRFTIIREVPYDRKNTSMAGFKMCRECEEEYRNIENRRYHAQPDACKKCGPRVSFLDSLGREAEGDPIEEARARLLEGAIVAVKGLGGFHLACLAEDEAAVRRLRQRKRRDERPLAVMAKSAETAEKLAFISDDELKALESPARPIVLLKKKTCGADHLSENGYIGIMLPYTPLHHLLFEKDLEFLVMTSANISELPIIYENGEALEKLSGAADYFLVHDRDIVTRCDDSLMWVLEGSEYFVRRSRGYVPGPVSLKGADGILALGAEQKASFTLVKEGKAFPGQHIGDLKTLETFEFYESQIGHFKRMFDIDIKTIACDLHPDMMSSEYAEELGKRLGLRPLKIQHHWAHMASCMADNGLEGEAIGVIWDGTGYGEDGTTWGGEILTGGYEGFKRFSRIRPIKLPGGDKAVREISRIGISLLEESLLPSEEFFEGGEHDKIRELLKTGLNCPLSSGMGRLFDGAAAIAGIKREANYEGQGAVLLEAAAGDTDEAYGFGLEHAGELLEADWRPVVRDMAEDIRCGKDTGLIAARFMNSLINMAVSVCREARLKSGRERVVLSGGTFQNMYLLRHLTEKLEREGFQVFRHKKVSTNDQGISLGQAAIAARIAGK